MLLLSNHTLLIILITVAISFWAWQSPKVMQRLIFYPPAVQRGQVDRFFAHGFIHADGMHLFFNMFTLYSFGQAIQKLYIANLGTLGFILFYLASIVVAIIPSYLKNKNNANYAGLGASGGVSAVIFAFILLDPWSTLLFFFIPISAIIFAVLYVAYSVYADRRGGSNINHSAHLVGGAFGVVATLIMEPRIVPHFFQALLQPKFLSF